MRMAVTPKLLANRKLPFDAPPVYGSWAGEQVNS
jgi:hypothetical protein